MSNGVPNLSFEGKTALVTGSTRGIGKAIADALWALGAMVIYTGTKRFSEVAAGGNKEYWSFDASSSESIAEIENRIFNLSRLDILVNNAGMNCKDSIDGLSDEDWDKVLQVNLTAPVKLMRAAAKNMKNHRGGGRILNVASLFALVNRPNRNAYSATKTGLVGITRSAAIELANENILVNALCPGFILTDMTRTMLSEEQRRNIDRIVPQGRMGTEKEMASIASFLVSDLNSYMTGQTITPDGGLSVSAGPGFE